MAAATIPDMATNKAKHVPPLPPEPGTFLLRVEDRRMLDALGSLAKRQRRSGNMALQVLLEDALKEAGLWPPPTDA